MDNGCILLPPLFLYKMNLIYFLLLFQTTSFFSFSVIAFTKFQSDQNWCFVVIVSYLHYSCIAIFPASLKEPLEDYIARWNGKVRLIRNKERKGLISTRTTGAEESRGEVVLFLDAHCEVNKNWLPPLLAPIYRDK